MKSITGKMINGLFITLVIVAFASMVQAATPIKVKLETDKMNYLLSEPVNTRMTMENISGGEVITPANFSNMKFYLLLVFTDTKSGKIITAREQAVSETPPTPHILPDMDGDGIYEQVEGIERLASGWFNGTGWFDAHTYYLLEPGAYLVTAQISARIIDASNVFTYEGKEYVNLHSGDWAGLLDSDTALVCIKADKDGDGYFYPACQPGELEDCNDSDPSVKPGAVEILNNGKDDDCNPNTPDVPVAAKGTISVYAELQTVGGGSKPTTTKEPINGVIVRIFDMSANSCVKKNYGVNWQNYKNIWDYCPAIGEDGYGVTNQSGAVTFQVPTGQYKLIGEYKTPTGNIYIGDNATVSAGKTEKKYLKVMAKVDGKKVPAKYTVLTGTELLIIEPEYIEWDGNQALYPFIFESIGDWGVVTSVAPPEGFIADYNNLSAEVNTDTKSLQFTITDIGSKWIASGVTHKIKHKGKTQTLNHSIGIKCSKELGKRKGFDEFCRKAK